MDWFLYDKDLRHERVKVEPIISYNAAIFDYICVILSNLFLTNYYLTITYAGTIKLQYHEHRIVYTTLTAKNRC